MDIHNHAARGDWTAMQAALDQGASVEAIDGQGLTPLMVAAASPQADLRTLQVLLDHGADVNALTAPPRRAPLDDASGELMESLGIDVSVFEPTEMESSVDSVLSYAAGIASADKIQCLLDAGADVSYVDANGYSVLLHAMYRPSGESVEDHLAVLRTLIDAGAPLDGISRHGESALSVGSQQGKFAAVTLLVERGANPEPLGWSPLFFAVTSGDGQRVAQLLDEGADLEQRDRWDRTPFLLAVEAGHLPIAELLLQRGADRSAKGRCGRTALMHAINSQSTAMLEWLLARGADVEEADQFGAFPLLEAARQGAVDCVRLLLAAGAAVDRRTRDGASPIKDAGTPEVVQVFVAAGQDLSEIEPAMRRQLLGVPPDPMNDVTVEMFQRYKHRTFGKRNPERMNNPLWDHQVCTRETAYRCAKQFGETSCEHEAVWCFQRFGHSMTQLPDGRYVEIGGEHEDYYDPDFCIYNDVVVHHGGGKFDLFGYPEDVFPPTDFHTATVAWPYIYIIGSLGYPHQRQFGETPVFRLDCQTWAMERVSCRGTAPGWIHRHKAKLLADDKIEVRDGLIDHGTGEKLSPNRRTFVLDLKSFQWSVRP